MDNAKVNVYALIKADLAIWTEQMPKQTKQESQTMPHKDDEQTNVVLWPRN